LCHPNPKPVRLDLRGHSNLQGIGTQFDLPALDYSLADEYPDVEATPGVPRDYETAKKTQGVLKIFLSNSIY
jgi:hypothetical protein